MAVGARAPPAKDLVFSLVSRFLRVCFCFQPAGIIRSPEPSSASHFISASPTTLRPPIEAFSAPSLPVQLRRFPRYREILRGNAHTKTLRTCTLGASHHHRHGCRTGRVWVHLQDGLCWRQRIGNSIGKDEDLVAGSRYRLDRFYGHHTIGFAES